MKMKNTLGILAAIIGSSAVTYWLVQKPVDHGHEAVAAETEAASHADEATKIAGLHLAMATKGVRRQTVTATGRVMVMPDSLVSISPRIEGKVVAAYGTVGDTVRKGQVMAIISSVDLAEARADYRRAQASLNAAKQGLQREMEMAKLGANSVRPVEEARSEHLGAQGDLADAKSLLSQAKSELAQAESELVQCKVKLQRAKELYAEKIVSKQELETAEAELKRDSLAVDAARSRVSQADGRVSTMQAKAEVTKQYLSREEKLLSGKIVDTRAVQSARSAVSAAQVELQSSIDKIKLLGAQPAGTGDTLQVTSPIAGRIAARHTNVGQMASPSDAMFTVANLSQVMVEADIYEKDIAQVRKGQNAEIRVDAYPAKVFTGNVNSISDILNHETRTAKIRCVVPNNQALLRGEMFANVLLTTGTGSSCVLVPKNAVLDDAGKKIVFTPCMECDEDIKANTNACGAYDKLEVTTGAGQGLLVEIASGLQPGTPVVTTGAYQLKTALGSGQLKAGCTDGH